MSEIIHANAMVQFFFAEFRRITEIRPKKRFDNYDFYGIHATPIKLRFPNCSKVIPNQNFEKLFNNITTHTRSVSEQNRSCYWEKSMT